MGTAQPDAIPDSIMAYHEAGHAVIAHLYGIGVERLSIVPRAGTGAPRATAPAPASGTRGQIAAVLGGGIANDLHGDSGAFRAGEQDRARARALALDGAGDATRADALLEEVRRETNTRLREPETWARVEAVAQALLWERTLAGENLRVLLAGNAG